MDKYELVKNLGAGSFGVTKLLRHKETKELVAMKFIPRGPNIDEYVAREIINHRSLRHPNVVGFKEVVLTPMYLVMLMEYVGGGELFDRVSNHGRLTEDEARYLFQQLISGVSYCHSKGICHRDLKLDNILLDGSEAQRLKICDFGFSKSSQLHSTPKSVVGSATYIAPEIIAKRGRQYDGKLADIWSCGVALFIMLVAAYPFDDPEDPKNFRKTLKRMMDVNYKIPDDLLLSQDCHDLISRIFVPDSSKRILINEIKNHPWFLNNLPSDLTQSAQAIYYQTDDDSSFSHQSVEEIMKIVTEAKIPSHPSSIASVPWLGLGIGDDVIEEEDEEEEEEEEEDEEEELEKEEEVELEEEDDDQELEEEEEKEK